MVCKVCQDMLYEESGLLRQAQGLNRVFRHHKAKSHLKDSAEVNGCYICRVIYDRLQGLTDIQDSTAEEDGRVFLYAKIKEVPRRNNLWQLDFRTENSQLFRESKPVASFVLVGSADSDSPDTEDLAHYQADATNETPSHTRAQPVSSTTDDPRVYMQAKEWIKSCEQGHRSCDALSEIWYPTRLVEVRSESGEVESPEIVKLVSRHPDEIRPNQPHFKGRYMTLSHRWGGAYFTKLTEESREDFQVRIYIKDLPKTFAHAIKLTRELQVRWIWIDALCIKQRDDDDWLYESSKMDQVYTNSYCNISATAAMNSSMGLFTTRDPSQEWVGNATLKVPGPKPRYVKCTVLDLYFWEDCVEQAPVNRRSWVLQERLLAPRVLHWCKDQIAFECRQEDKAECRPKGLPHLQLRNGALVDGARLKGIDIGFGKELRRQRLSEIPKFNDTDGPTSPLDQVDENLYYYELWKRVVDSYTKMELTQERDRLIALSGVARMITRVMETRGIKDQYIAGLWRKGLASQLLWYVNEGEGEDRQPLERTRREYRAPTWSWASVETARGITFGDITSEGMRISVEMVRLTYRKNDDFGLINDGYIIIKGVLRRAVLHDRMVQLKLPVREEPPEQEENHNVVTENFNSPSAWSNAVSHIKSAPSLLPLTTLLIGCIAFWQSTKPGASMSMTKFMLSIWLLLSALQVFSRQSSTSLNDDQAEMGQGGTKHIEKTHTDGGSTTVVSDFEETDLMESKDINRFSWQLLKDGKPTGAEFETIYLDSPATPPDEPSIFGVDAQIFVLPALLDDKRLICLIVQATDGEYGVRYKRVGLTKIQTIFEDHIKEIIDIVTPPGNNEVELAKYYWGPQGKMSGESTICII